MLGLCICMIILHFQQIFEDASGSEYGMVVYASVTQGSEYGTVVYASVTQSSDMSDYGSIHLNNAWICLNML